MKWKHVLLVALFVLPVIALLAFGFGRDPHAVPFALAGKPAPRFNLTSLDGKPVSLDSLLGKPVVINFWSSWCVPCAAEHEVLQQTAQRLGDKVRFVGIVYQDTDENARNYLASRSNVFPQLKDDDTKVAIDYGVAGVPETFFIDASGTLRNKHAGALGFDDLLQQLGALQ